jgi:hypothetical protein
VGTTGSGDSTIAGFINGLLRNLPPVSALTAAVAVGACNVEAADALSGVPDWGVIEGRISAGWERLYFEDVPAGWKKDSRQQIWVGPQDRQIQE